MVDGLTLLAKALRPLPEKWHGLADVETRYRQRYLDLATNVESRQVFEVRAALVKGIREFLDSRGFLEVETPMMQVIPGGAAARPFKTHHNALDMDLYLRIAPELFLEAAAGGRHPPRLRDQSQLPQRGDLDAPQSRVHHAGVLLGLRRLPADDGSDRGAAHRARRDGLPSPGQGEPHLGGQARGSRRPWARYTMREAITHFAGVPAERLETAESVFTVLGERGLEIPKGGTWGHLLMGLFEHTVEQHLFNPTFITDHPTDVSPLSKQRQDDPRVTERFELYIGGSEIANGFSELNDPDVQADRFRQQVAARGDRRRRRGPPL